LFLYYRGRALALAAGLQPVDLLLEAAGSAEAPFSGGRQMPSHWGHRGLRVFSRSSQTGMQWLQAVGCAEAGLYYRQMPESQPEDTAAGKPEVVCVTGGDGSTSEGEFFEALNVACRDRLPVLYLIEDNGYAISVPVERQTPGGSISQLLAGYPDLLRLEVDGTDFLASYQALQKAVDYCRAGRGPAMIHGHVVRLHSHSVSDDHRYYKTKEELAEETSRDPLPKFAAFLEAEGLLTSEDRKQLEQDVRREIEEAADKALRAPMPEAQSATEHVYSPSVNPTGKAFETDPQPTGEPRTMADLLNACLRDELKRNPRMIVYGEDVAAHEQGRQTSSCRSEALNFIRFEDSIAVPVEPGIEEELTSVIILDIDCKVGGEPGLDRSDLADAVVVIRVIKPSIVVRRHRTIAAGW